MLAIFYQYIKNKKNTDSYSNISNHHTNQLNNTRQLRTVETNEMVEFSNPAFHMDEWMYDRKASKKSEFQVKD